MLSIRRALVIVAALASTLAASPALAQSDEQLAQTFSDGVNLCRTIFGTIEASGNVPDVIKASSFVAAPLADYGLPFARIFTRPPGDHLLLKPKWAGEAEPILYANFTVLPGKPTKCVVAVIEASGAEAEIVRRLDSAGEGWMLKGPEKVFPDLHKFRVYERTRADKSKLELLLHYGQPRGFSANAEITVVKRAP